MHQKSGNFVIVGADGYGAPRLRSNLDFGGLLAASAHDSVGILAERSGTNRIQVDCDGFACAMDHVNLKRQVYDFWQAAPCGTRGIPDHDRRAFFEALERERYEWEPYIQEFAKFNEGRGKQVLEIGVGAGTDFVNWVRAGAVATGVDLTEQAVALTRERLALEGLAAEVMVADAENLPFPDGAFDLVYAYGVLHNSPDTPKAISEVYRVLRPGGTARVMIYHCPSWTGLMLWTLHCAAKGRPWRGPKWAMYHHLESPGTKSYSRSEALSLFSMFSSVSLRTQLSHGDLLLMRPSEKYRPFELAWKLYPRWLIRLTGNVLGTGLMIEVVR